MDAEGTVMTVEELIHVLRQFPADMDVTIYSGGSLDVTGADRGTDDLGDPVVVINYDA